MSDYVPRFRRLSARELDAALLRLDLTNTEFCHLTGVSAKTLRRWLYDDMARDYLEPPFWITSWLAAAEMPGVLDRLRQVAADNCENPLP
jgi:hypothetical protein